MARRILRGVLLCSLAVVLALGTLGCGFKANVIVQLVNSATSAPYAVDQMTVYLELEGGSTVSGVTGTTGAATFTVTEAGTYRVVRVDGKDVTGGAVGDEGREYVKDSPLTTVEPLTSYAFTGTLPNVAVDKTKQDYTIDAEIPRVQRVTIVDVQNLDFPETEAKNLNHAEAFAGRVMLRDVDFGSNGVVGIWAPNSSNRFVLYPGQTTLSVSLYSSSGSVPLLSATTVTAPYSMVFEVKGNGDWVMNAVGTNVTRESLGGADPTRDFNSFSAGYLNISNGGSQVDPPSQYKVLVEAQEFQVF